jgi:hypothetical protein
VALHNSLKFFSKLLGYVENVAAGSDQLMTLVHRLFASVRRTALAIVALCLFPAGWYAYADVAPILRTKRVTVTLLTGKSAQFVFSAAQPDNELIYIMKTEYAPELERSPARYIEQTTDTPYRQFLSERLPTKLVRSALLIVGSAVVLWAVLVLVLQRIGRRLAAIVPDN